MSDICTPVTIGQFKQLDPGPCCETCQEQQEVSQVVDFICLLPAWANAGTWDTGTIGLSLEMWQLRFYTDDKASTNFKQLPSELP